MNTSKHLFTIEDEKCERLDSFLTKRYPLYSRAYFQELIENKQVLINGEPPKKRTVPSIGDQIEVFLKKRAGPDLTPQNIPLDVLYEDSHLIAVNKPSGMVVHPAPGNWSNTFVNALLNHCEVASTSDVRPGIVHRLDKETSGVMLAAKTEECHRKLCELFATRTIKKEYLAIALGKVPSLEIKAAIKRCKVHRKKMRICNEEGKEAITETELLGFNGNFSLVCLKPHTGRTHQIRVHLKSLGNPILGDKLYGNPSINDRYKTSRHYLHAKKITFIHPITHVKMDIEAPVPKEMSEMFQCGF